MFNHLSLFSMKKILSLVVIASLSLLSVGAQTRSHDMATPRHQLSLTRANLPATTQEMKKNTVPKSVAVPMKAFSGDRPYYRRPAGAYISTYVAKDGCGFWSYGDNSFLLVRPFSNYTYRAENIGNYSFFWASDDFDGNDVDVDRDHIVHYGDLERNLPQLYFSSSSGESWSIYQYPFYYPMYGNDNWWNNDDYPMDEDYGPHLLVVPAVTSDMAIEENYEFLLGSKALLNGGNVSDGAITRFTGAEPYGTNKYGWWFGKNGSHVDGIAQAFEKPTYPYLLKKVYLQTYNDLRVKDDVKMTCRVYRLDKIPSFVAGDCATLPEVPGKLIVFGEALVTPRTAEDKNGLIEFTLFDCEEYDHELVFEYNPTIDFPILVCIDGYNDPEMENLEEFSAFISTNWNVDEGYGELAYVKYPIYEVQLDENGDTIKDSRERPITAFNGHYYWCGLNNFFSGPMEMKTGLTIFIATERPYLNFNNPYETGKYEFGIGGGDCCIEFYSWMPTHDDEWTLLCNGDEELPDWLHFELVDGEEDGLFNNIVTAHVTADPLPQDVRSRSAVIRFGFPGAYKDYHFSQRMKLGPCDLGSYGDGEITIATINYLINLILNDMYDNCYDVNMDGELNIADINGVIDYILRK